MFRSDVKNYSEGCTITSKIDDIEHNSTRDLLPRGGQVEGIPKSRIYCEIDGSPADDGAIFMVGLRTIHWFSRAWKSCKPWIYDSLYSLKYPIYLYSHLTNSSLYSKLRLS